MKKYLYIVAILVTGAAVFFSYRNQCKLETEKQIYLDTVAANETRRAEIKEAEGLLRDERRKLDDAKKLRDERIAAIEAAKTLEVKLKKDFAESEATLEEQNQKLADLEKIRQQAEQILGQAGVALEELPAKVEQIRNDKKNLDKKLEQLRAEVEAANAKLAKNRAEVARLADRKATRDISMRRNAMEAVITGVNQEWGFVVVGSGSKTGFTPQSTLLVKRDGRVICRLKPSSIEPNQTVAEIDFDSLAPGVRLRPGDRVIIEKPAT